MGEGRVEIWDICCMRDPSMQVKGGFKGKETTSFVFGGSFGCSMENDSKRRW